MRAIATLCKLSYYTPFKIQSLLVKLPIALKSAYDAMNCASISFLLAGSFTPRLLSLRWRPPLICVWSSYSTRPSFGHARRVSVRNEDDRVYEFERNRDEADHGCGRGGSLRQREREKRAERGPRSWSVREVRDDAWRVREAEAEAAAAEAAEAFKRRDTPGRWMERSPYGGRERYTNRDQGSRRSAEWNRFRYTNKDREERDQHHGYRRYGDDRGGGMRSSSRKGPRAREFGGREEFDDRADFSSRRKGSVSSRYRGDGDFGSRSRVSPANTSDKLKTPIQLALSSSDDLLYGIQPVLGALRNARRTFQTLYVQDNIADPEGNVARKADNAAAISSVIAYAKIHKVEITHSDKGDLNVLAGNRPHQGFVLQASPLSYTALAKLPNIAGPSSLSGDENNKNSGTTAGSETEKKLSEEESTLGISAASVALDGSTIVGTDGGQLAVEPSSEVDAESEHGSAVPLSSREVTQVSKPSAAPKVANSRPPCWLALDEISDPQNLGALLRSAYFLGATGVCLSRRNCSPLTPIVSKASAGALESMEVYAVGSMPRFLRHAADAGWRVLATAVEDDALPCHELRLDAPTVIVLGSEGRGLRALVRKACTGVVKIQGPVECDDAVDSLNVSVAGGIVLHQLLGQ